MKTCYQCKGPMAPAIIDHMAHREASFALIKNVRVEKCTQCGEVYMDALTSRAIDMALEQAKTTTEFVEVPVVYAPPAA